MVQHQRLRLATLRHVRQCRAQHPDRSWLLVGEYLGDQEHPDPRGLDPSVPGGVLQSAGSSQLQSSGQLSGVAEFWASAFGGYSEESSVRAETTFLTRGEEGFGERGELQS